MDDANYALKVELQRILDESGLDREAKISTMLEVLKDLLGGWGPVARYVEQRSTVFMAVPVGQWAAMTAGLNGSDE